MDVDILSFFSNDSVGFGFTQVKKSFTGLFYEFRYNIRGHEMKILHRALLEHEYRVTESSYGLVENISIGFF